MLLLSKLPGSEAFRALVVAWLWTQVDSYAGSPQLNRRAIAGLWRLSGQHSVLPVLQEFGSATQQRYPMKEFTVYPKKKNHPKPPLAPESEGRKDLLLMLQEDGSFRQYGDRTEMEEERDKLKKKLGKLKEEKVLRGTWDYLDGKLILAADRPSSANKKEVQDTILVGEVVATSEKSLADHPPTVEEKEQEEKNLEQEKNLDTHLSVPKGSVEVGRFMYPKTHPSFFEQPIFSPKPTGSFELKQVLGSLNAQNPEAEEEIIEKFTKNAFVDKKFFLTSHPLEKRKPKGQTRWSIKYNKFVEDPPKKSKQEKESEKNAPIPIRVLEVVFFANNTFTTVAGLGSATVLRGKWDVIGREKDQFWMQIWRFGFGRSVSGSTYSEGMGLTREDEKAYWGRIEYVEDDDKTDEATPEQSMDSERTEAESDAGEDATDDTERRVQVKGSVLDGWGLEPEPVARFIMREATEDELYDDEDEEEEEDVDGKLDRLFRKEEDDEGLDWSNAFQ